MKDHGGWGGYGDYSHETERRPFPNIIDMAAGLTQGLYLAYRVATYPIRKGLEALATKTTKTIIKTTIRDSDGDFD